MIPTTLRYNPFFVEEPIHEEAGLVRWRFVVEPRHFNPAGTLHGGVLSTVLDSAMGHAVRTLRPPEMAHAAIYLHVDFLNATRAPGVIVTVEGRVAQMGRRVAFAEGVATDDAGRTLARAASSYAIISLSTTATSS